QRDREFVRQASRCPRTDAIKVADQIEVECDRSVAEYRLRPCQAQPRSKFGGRSLDTEPAAPWRLVPGDQGQRQAQYCHRHQQLDQGKAAAAVGFGPAQAGGAHVARSLRLSIAVSSALTMPATAR